MNRIFGQFCWQMAIYGTKCAIGSTAALGFLPAEVGGEVRGVAHGDGAGVDETRLEASPAGALNGAPGSGLRGRDDSYLSVGSYGTGFAALAGSCRAPQARICDYKIATAEGRTKPHRCSSKATPW